MTIRHGAFPQCCGISVVSNFGGTPTGSRDDEANEAEVKREIARIRRETATGLHLIALNEQQEKKFSKWIINEGYIKWGEKFYHGGHGNWLQLYGWTRFDKNGNKVVYDSSPNVKEVKGPEVSFRGFITTTSVDWTAQPVPDRSPSISPRVAVPLSTRGGQRSATPRPGTVSRTVSRGRTRITER